VTGMPAVSVIMAAYNGAGLIGETIASLQAQTFGDFEIVVVDDCSTDDTRGVLAALAVDEPRLRIIHAAENGGPVRARNRAFAEARGRYVAGLDQDDLCLPDRLATQVAYLDAHRDVVLLGASAAIFDGTSARPSHLPVVTTPALIEWLLQIINPLVWSSVMVRREVALRLDPFTRPDRLYAEDFDLYHRLMAHGRVARIDRDLLLYRQHGGGASQRYVATMHASAAQVLADAYAPVFGEDAAERAALIVRHVMGRVPVPDRATLALLGETVTRLQAAFFARAAVGREDRRLIRWQTARLWGRIGKESLRAGGIGLHDAIAVRPDHLGLSYNRIEQLAVDQAVGQIKRVMRRG